MSDKQVRRSKSSAQDGEDELEPLLFCLVPALAVLLAAGEQFVYFSPLMPRGSSWIGSFRAGVDMAAPSCFSSSSPVSRRWPCFALSISFMAAGDTPAWQPSQS